MPGPSRVGQDAPGRPYKLTDDNLDVIAGKRDLLAGKIQETYGITKDEAEKQLSTWEKSQEEPKVEAKPSESR